MSIAMKYPNLVMRGAEFIPIDRKSEVPKSTRGVYALLKERKRGEFYNVVYIGLSTEGTGIRARLLKHSREKDKKGKWTHFSFFEVWPNVPNKWIEEMEALFLHFFRKHDRERLQTLKLNGTMKAAKFKQVIFDDKHFEKYSTMDWKGFIRSKRRNKSKK